MKEKKKYLLKRLKKDQTNIVNGLKDIKIKEKFLTEELKNKIISENVRNGIFFSFFFN